MDFERFEQEELSHSLIDQYSGELVALAHREFGRDPSAEPVGVIAMPDSPLSEAIRPAVENVGASADLNIRALTNRVSCLRLLEAHAPSWLDWFHEHWEPAERLIIVCASKDGYRLADVTMGGLISPGLHAAGEPAIFAEHDLAPDLIDAMVEGAREFIAEHPGVGAVALVHQSPSEEAAQMRALLESQADQEATADVILDGGFCLTVPRHVGLEVLRQRAPRLLDWLESAEVVDGRQRIPFICVAHDGYSLGVIEFDT